MPEYIGAPVTTLRDALDTDLYRQHDVNVSGPYDRGWRSAGLAEEGNALADEALKAGIRGDKVERERLRGLSQARLQEAASWAPEVRTTADITDVPSALQWAAGGLGSGFRSTLPSAAGGLAGAAATLLTRGRVNPVVGGMIGGGYPAYAMEQEEAAGEALHDPRIVQRNTDSEILRASRLKGAVTALPEVALPAIVGGKVVGQGAKALIGGTPLRHIGAQTLKGGAVEGGTEYGQALVGQATQNELRGDPLTDFNQRAALEEAAIGTLVGKTLGAAGGVADVAHHKLVKPAVHAGKEIKKDPLGKVTDTIVDTIGALGTVAAKAKYGVEDYITEREARKAGMSYEELMLSRMPDISPVGKSQEQLEAELRTDDEQRMAAASVLAQRLAANPDASPALRQAAADFEQRTQQGDPTAYEALSSVLRDENTKREVREELLNNVSSWLEGKGFKLPPERRGSAMTPGEDVDAKTKQLWLKKHSHLSGAYNTTFPSDDAARISADAVFEWVKQGFPNFNAVARGLATMWGKEASLVVKDAHDYMVAEGLTQRSERLDEVLKKLDMTAGGKAQRLKMLGEMVRPSEQDKLTTMDIIVMDRLLDQFALGKIKNLGTFNEHMDRVFGKNKADVIAQYEALNQDELIEDTGTDDRRDETDGDEERMAELESQTEDWNSGVQEKNFPTEYRGMRGENSVGYDTLYDGAQTALNDAVREARGKGEQASVVGAWDKAQRESEGDESALKNNEDDLIAKYGGLLRSAEIKRHAKEKGVEEDAAARELLSAALDDYAKVQGLPVDQVRDSMLRALNRRVRFVAVNASDKIDSVDMTNADVNALKVRYKDDSKKYGVLVFEKIAAERQVEQTDAETGEARKLAVMTPLKEPQEWTTTSRKLIGFIRKAKNLDAGESFGAAQQLEQLYAGITSLFETGMFSGRVGYRQETGGEVTWIDSKARMPADFPLAGEATVADAKKAAAEKRKGGEKEDRPADTKYAETLQEKRRELSRLANRKVEEDGEERYALPAAARKEIAEALKKGEKAVNALYGRLRNQYDPALWMDKPKQSATIRSKKATRQAYDKKAYYNAKGERVDELRDDEAGTIVRRQSGFDETETTELVAEAEEMSMAAERKESDKPRTHDELTDEPLHPAQRVEAKDVDTTQPDFVLDLLRKGMPAFNAMVNKATAEQRAKIKALIEKMLNSTSNMKAKVWGKNPPKDAEQFARRARLALKTLEEGQSKEQWTLEEMEEAKAGEKHAERMTAEEAKEEQWTLEEMEEAKAGEKHAERMTAEEAEVRPFVVLPRTSPYTAKDQAKSDKANKFIGRGSAASSTAAYAKAWGVRANSGAYEATDTVFVSVEGARTGRKVLDTEELQRALDAGATIITDDAANRGRSYNVGERTLAAYLKYHAYEEAAPGEWKPVDAQDEGDKKAQVRSLIKEGKIEEAKALSEKPQTQLREAKPGEPGSKENPHSVPMSYAASSSELRPELRKKYANIKRIAELIASGDRTGTTRTPQRGVLPGHYVTFPGVPGVYRVTGFERIDLNTPEGIARWEAREGWDREATKQRFAGQVDHGKIQMLFERAKDVAAPINIYYGAGENAHLSNLARRPFTGEDKREYRSVEHAYQAWKSGAFDADAYERGKTAAKAAGSLGTKTEGGWNFKLMERLIRRSFEQNPDAAKRLIETSDAPLTHTQDKGVWRTKFPELLMKVRKDLKATGKPSAQSTVVSEPLTDEQKQKIRDELVKTVNLEPVWAKLIRGTDGKPWSGDWTPDMIRIAIAAADPEGVARHESIHQFFYLLRKNGGENVRQVLERLSQNNIIRKRLEALLEDHPAAIKQLSDPEEFAAYAYQFWRAERLELGPKTEGFFQRVWTALKEMLGLVQKQVKDAQHAEQILQAFSEGKVAKEPDIVIQALENDAKAHNQRVENMRTLLRDGKLHQALRKAVFTAQGTLEGYNIEALTKAGKLFNTGEGDTLGKQSYFEAKAQETAKRLNQLRDILNGGLRYIDGKWTTTDIKPTKKDIELLSEALRAQKRPNDAVVGRMYDSVRQFLKEMHAYLKGAGTARWDEETKQWVPMGEIHDYVLPQVWDVEKIMENPQQVIDKLMEKHLPILEKIAQDAGGAKPEQIAQAIVQRIIASAGANELEESTMDIGMTPYMRSVNKRTLNWIDAESFAEFMQKDVVNILSSYTVQGVKRAEYVRRFDNGGTKLSALTDEALVETVAGKGEIGKYRAKLKKEIKDWVKAGAKSDAPTMRDVLSAEKGEEATTKGLQHLDPAFKALMAMEGTLGYNIDPRVRQLMSGVTTYQNLRLLWLALFASFGDPLGIVVRGGEMKDAWNAFTRGVREVRLRWKNEHSTDDMAKLAEQLGTVDAGSFLDALGQTYSSVFMYGKFKTINDALFKWNGMEAWNRAMRIQATGAAVGFIKSHLTKPGEHSLRYMKDELGLDPAKKDKWLMKDGELDYSRDEVKTAIMRWVDGAILRPNAAQRPVVASDPHYALFYHLKQFVYSFHKTILKRAYVEAQHGNWSPAMALVAAYIPVMIAADLAKEMLLPDDDPPWMKQGLSGAVSHGFWRANLLGIPGMGVETYRRGDASSVLGPQIDQLADLISVPFSERHTALGEGLGALPGGSVWRRMAD